MSSFVLVTVHADKIRHVIMARKVAMTALFHSNMFVVVLVVVALVVAKCRCCLMSTKGMAVVQQNCC